MAETFMSQHVKITKELQVYLDSILQKLKTASCLSVTADFDRLSQRASRERSIAITKLQEAIMWLGMDLKGLKEDGLSDEPNPYPESYNPNSGEVAPTAQGLKL